MCINKTDNIQNSGNDKLEKMRKVYKWFTCRKIVNIIFFENHTVYVFLDFLVILVKVHIRIFVLILTLYNGIVPRDNVNFNVPDENITSG